MKSHSERRDKRRYCRFHKEYDHDTKECRDLQYQIEDLIRLGHLRRYVGDQSSLLDSRPPRDSSPLPKGPVEKQINVIFGGPASGGDSSSARKAYARSEVGKRPTHDEDLDITFKSGGEEYPCHDDVLVISICMANAYVKRVMIDTGSSTDILYFDAFQKLGLTDKDLVTLTSTLTGFTGDFVSPLGATMIHVTFEGEPRSKSLMVSFMVVKLPSAYNAIIGRPTLNRLKAVVSTYHWLLKFPTRAGVGEVQSVAVVPQNPEDSARDPHPTEQVLEVPLDPSHPDRLVKVGSKLTEGQQIQLVEFLRKNEDVFAWSPKDMSGVDPKIAQHHLNITPDTRPVKQRPRKFTPDRQKAVEDEVVRLLDAELIEKVKYPTWLSNVVLVKKANGKWRICHVGTPTALLIDAFSGYNQIRMAPERQRKYSIHHSQRHLLLQGDDAIWAEECQCDIPAVGKLHVQGPSREEHGDLRGRHDSQKSKDRGSPLRFGRNIPHAKEIQDASQPGEMYLRHHIRKVPRLYCVSARDRCQSQQDKGDTGNVIPQDDKGGLTTYRQTSGPKPLHLPSRGQELDLLLSAKVGKRFHVDPRMREKHSAS
ncbi:hypothetical protein OPV22_003203 [Ensete ventricosum]|uniref:Reverse transcriptase domain-containing protein n=1 Tax=Ensete ventricosum TaxID=4639 RepID=A0AAV8S0A9_ENSVE|nr:hypothetical protein OPV22_003203 [Ensete ventricosum]